MHADLDQFDDGGLPLSEGTFRQFAVTVTIGQEARTHTAAELCWSAQEQCAVFDPNIDFLNSMHAQADDDESFSEPISDARSSLCTYKTFVRYPGAIWIGEDARCPG